MSLYSPAYDDIYFSRDGGLDETKAVFLDGNNLPAAWQGQRRFCIAETGFGTGLNLLAAAKLFQETAQNGQILDFISVEKHPLEPQVIAAALADWRDELAPFVDRLVDNYPMQTPGFHRFWLTPSICVTLFFGDAAQAYAQVCSSVDCWFLDGFTPDKNPDMWCDALYAQMARLSHRETTLATFTVARAVRDGLSQAGFQVEKRPGFAHKRHRLVGHFTGSQPRPEISPPHSVRILGAGIAGCAVTARLSELGIKTHLIDPHGIGAGGSGNLMGMANLRLSSPANPAHQFYTCGFDYALRRLLSTKLSTGLPTICQTPSLQIPHGKKFEQALHHVNQMNWPARYMTQIDAGGASDLAGIKLSTQAIVIHDVFAVTPKDVCGLFASKATDLSTSPNAPLNHTDTDLTIHCTAHQTAGLPLKPVRGQTIWTHPTHTSIPLKATLNFGGYFMPTHPSAGLHVLGATFDRGDTGADLRDADTEKLCHMAATYLPDGCIGAIGGAWAGVRAASPDRNPIVGKLDAQNYYSVAHGSHGIVSALMAAEVIVSDILGLTAPISADGLDALSPKRFRTNSENAA